MLLAALPALAAEQVLVSADGDRLSGRVIRVAEGWIEFDSRLLGRIRVESARAHLEPALAIPASDAAAGIPDDARAGGTGPADGQGLAAPAAGMDPTDSAAPAGGPDVAIWNNAMGSTLHRDRGSRETRSDQFELNIHLQRTRGPHRSQVDLDYEFDRDDGLVKDDDWSIRARQERILGERYFLASRFSHRDDVDAGERERVRTLAVTGGWRIAHGDRSELKVGPGYVLADLADADGQARERGPALYASWTWALPREISLSGTSVYVVSSLPGGRAYYWESDLRLDWPLTQHFGLAWTWDYARNTYPFNTGDSSKMRWLITWRP